MRGGESDEKGIGANADNGVQQHTHTHTHTHDGNDAEKHRKKKLGKTRLQPPREKGEPRVEGGMGGGVGGGRRGGGHVLLKSQSKGKEGEKKKNEITRKKGAVDIERKKNSVITR